MDRKQRIAHQVPREVTYRLAGLLFLVAAFVGFSLLCNNANAQPVAPSLDPTAEPTRLPDFRIEPQVAVCRCLIRGSEICDRSERLSNEMLARSRLMLSGLWRRIWSPGMRAISVAFTHHADRTYTARVNSSYENGVTTVPTEARMPGEPVNALHAALMSILGMPPPPRWNPVMPRTPARRR